ncbi:hypothetical protein TetV_335 [Tetraselmis virus 1]|uniref:Uncharacterized protein n=1 Tax=Tetraselmis virus 1 TaxID=2060617 RepID=A0A2P0VNE5_9VIRU|nr:hypothetical protein QJ968_gp335 [Tetraselmis virus 1]AUF82427.1 hypothetical protein TetV_335 [Tetraselmis virus 1]
MNFVKGTIILKCPCIIDDNFLGSLTIFYTGAYRRHETASFNVLFNQQENRFEAICVTSQQTMHLKPEALDHTRIKGTYTSKFPGDRGTFQIVKTKA